MSCPPPADPAAPVTQGWVSAGLCCPQGLAQQAGAWQCSWLCSTGELSQAGCATGGVTRVQQRACDLSRLVGEKGESKSSCFINVLWCLAGSNTLVFYSSLGRFLLCVW